MKRYWKVKVLFLFVVLVASGKPVFSQIGSSGRELKQAGIPQCKKLLFSTRIVPEV